MIERGEQKWKKKRCKKDGKREMKKKKKETTEDLIHLTWAIREHIGHFV